MNIRLRFEQELITIQQQLMELSEASIRALDEAFNSFLIMDKHRLEKVIEQDIAINELETKINDQVLLLIAKQQPVAKDLRRLMLVVKAASDFERVGDYAVNIAKEALEMNTNKFITTVEPLEAMHYLTTNMLKGVSEAYIEENEDKGTALAKMDDEVDLLFGTTIKYYLSITINDAAKLSQITHLAFICKHIERCADHATNIAEHLYYLVHGSHSELNR